MIYVHFPFSISSEKRTASRSIQAERCNFIAFLSNLRSKHLIAIIGEGVDEALGVVNAANLTDDMDNRLADLEVRLYAVMLEQDDIGILLCNDVREMLECARSIRHEHRELQLTAAGDQALFHNLVDKGYVDIAAGQHADDLLAAYIHLVVEHSRERSRTGGLNDLLAALEQQQNSGSNLVIGNRDNAVHILLDRKSVV